MCGRYILIAPGKLIAETFQLPVEPELEPRYNIAPSQDVHAVLRRPGVANRELSLLRWGLVPFWAEDTKIGHKMINARAESAAEKPAFRAAYKYRRCLLPADGFYEWKREGKKKLPFLVRLRSQEPFGLAGLWEHWEGAHGEVVESCTILTTTPNDAVAAIHDRMPVILRPKYYEEWLDPTNHQTRKLTDFLQPYPAEDMMMYRVSAEVNSPKNDHPACIEPVDPD